MFLMQNPNCSKINLLYIQVYNVLVKKTTIYFLIICIESKIYQNKKSSRTAILQ